MGFRSNIVKHAIVLDKYTMINASYAKLMFSEKTISEVILYLATRLRVKLNLTNIYQNQWHKFKAHWYMLNRELSKNTILTIKSNMALLRYQISVYGIYIERLLNPQ